MAGSPLARVVEEPSPPPEPLSLAWFRGKQLLAPVACDTPLLQKGGLGDAIKLTKAAIRGLRFRSKQDADFKKREAQRKADERATTSAEAERIAEIEKIRRHNPDKAPFLLAGTVCAADGTPVTIDGKPYKTSGSNQKLITVGRIEDLETKDTRIPAPNRVVKPVGAKGFGPTGEGWDENTRVWDPKTPKEYDNSYVPVFKKDKNVKTLRRFIFENTKVARIKNKVETQIVTIVDDRKVVKHGHAQIVGHRVCLICNERISLGSGRDDDIGAAFHHFEDRHPEAFKTLMGRLTGKIEKTVCSEDHAGMVRRYGGADFKVVCKECGEVLYKPARSVRTKDGEFDDSEIVK